MPNKLEFEAAYKLLESKLQELKDLSVKLNCDFSSEIANVEKRLNELKEERYQNLTPWEQVLMARDLERPMTRDYIRLLLSDWVEMHGDRVFGDDPAIVGGVGLFCGRAVTVLGHQKGKDTPGNISHNFGMPHPEGYRKAFRLMQEAEKFNRPVLTFINTPGAYPGTEAEERGQAWAISQLLLLLSRIRVPVVSLVTGEGGSGGALALTGVDRIIMLSNAVYSVASPETCASILFRDVKKADESASALKLTARALLEIGIVDEVIEEPAHEPLIDSESFISSVKRSLKKSLDILCSLEPQELVERRYQRLSQIGEFHE